jgi:hypothetical protein
MSTVHSRTDVPGTSSTPESPLRADQQPTEQGHVRECRATAIAAGILFMTGTVAGILVKFVAYYPMHAAGDPFAYAAEHSGVVVTGALLTLVMGLSLALMAVVLYPVLRRLNEVLATGYLITRGAVETVCYIVLAIAWLLLVPLSEAVSAGPGTASPEGVRLGTTLIESEGAGAVLSLVFCFGAALFYVLLYRSRIVPRWITLWGLMAIPFYVAAAVLVMYGVMGGNSSGSDLLDMPLAVQEMVLAVWMIARGFRPATVVKTTKSGDATVDA